MILKRKDRSLVYAFKFWRLGLPYLLVYLLYIGFRLIIDIEFEVDFMFIFVTVIILANYLMKTVRFYEKLSKLTINEYSLIHDVFEKTVEIQFKDIFHIVGIDNDKFDYIHILSTNSQNTNLDDIDTSEIDKLSEEYILESLSAKYKIISIKKYFYNNKELVSLIDTINSKK